MYWLSNSVVLRTIISGMTQKMDLSLSSSTQSSKDNAGKQSVEIPSSLKWKSSSHRNGNANGGTVCDWEDHNTFVSALERVETWIFSRAIESIWWQVSHLFCSHFSPSPRTHLYSFPVSRALRSSQRSLILFCPVCFSFLLWADL